MKKNVLFLLILVIFTLFITNRAYAAPDKDESWLEDIDNLLTKQINEMNTAEWEHYLKYVEGDYTVIIDAISIDDLLRDLVKGNFSFSWQDFFNYIIRVFFKEFSFNISLMAKIIVIAVLCGIFKNMNDSFESQSVGDTGYYVCYFIIMFLVIQSFLSILSVSRTGIERMFDFMLFLFPVLMGLLTSVGHLSSVSVMQPAIAVLISTVGSVLANIVFPLTALSAVVTLVNHISKRIQIHKLGKLLNNLCAWILTLVFTIFIGVLTIQGAITSVFDGVSIRAAKFAVDTFVPIIGKVFSQSLDVIIGCSLLIKNAVGAAGLITITLLCLAPAIKIISLLFLYKFAGALLEPITDERITKALNGIANVLIVISITVIGIALMFFLTITLIIGTGNTSLIMR
ncbi:MAG: stage III sporulation protein AE [Caldicoprobacterales bacterium]|jgi:stage III sporulation protein AE